MSCSYSAIVIGKWCSFLEASCLNRRPGQGTSGTSSLSSSLASELERGSSSYAYPPLPTAFNKIRSIVASRVRETCVVLTTRVRSNKGDALFKLSRKTTNTSFVQIRANSVLIRPFFHRYRSRSTGCDGSDIWRHPRARACVCLSISRDVWVPSMRRIDGGWM